MNRATLRENAQKRYQLYKCFSLIWWREGRRWRQLVGRKVYDLYVICLFSQEVGMIIRSIVPHRNDTIDPGLLRPAI